MSIVYHDLRDVSPVKAREIVRKVLAKQNGNVSATARILGISRQTVRRARDGALQDASRRPLISPRKTESRLEELIVSEAKRTGFRYRSLASYLQRSYGLPFSENTVKAILRRNAVQKRTRRAASGKRRPLYDYENLIPFTEFQLDTKHLLDKDALPQDVYAHMQSSGLPRYEWNFIEVATRARFTAYSHELSAHFGLSFILLVVLWLRAHNVRQPITIRQDNGLEFCSGSAKKLAQWNQYLSSLGTTLHAIPPGAKHLMALVENSHRADDEFFLIPHAGRCLNPLTFLYKAQRWQDTWNFFKPHHGIAMHGFTPREKLSLSRSLIHHHILQFPVLLMEHVVHFLNPISRLIKDFSGGKYVPTTCQKQSLQRMIFFSI